MNQGSSPLSQKPLYQIRTPGHEEEMHRLMEQWWRDEEFRERVSKAFSQCESPGPYLMFDKVTETDIWITYVMDYGTHKLFVVKIGSESEDLVPPGLPEP